jgi:glucose-1-phosphate cytidylyltransferase
MKVVILAGGFGTRISEETDLKPKPMIEIGGEPLLWHIMKMYSHHGINEFIVCCGHKGYIIKQYFANYFLHRSDVTFHMLENRMEVHDERAESWKVTLVDTGETSQTGGRLAAVSKYIMDEECFCLTYGDGVSDVDISSLIAFHKEHGKMASITSVFPSGRFGALEMEGSLVKSFMEKPKGDGALVNGGFFVLSPEVLGRISSPNCIWEREPLMSLAADGELMGYEHKGFWQPMDTLRDKVYLEELWNSSKAPWKTWKE